MKADYGIEGLQDEPKPGHPRRIGQDKIAEIVATTFLRRLDKDVPDKQLHLILDNYGAQKHEKVQKWLRRHKRFHLHFTPAGASWMNMVEIWFAY